MIKEAIPKFNYNRYSQICIDNATDTIQLFNLHPAVLHQRQSQGCKRHTIAGQDKAAVHNTNTQEGIYFHIINHIIHVNRVINVALNMGHV